MLSKIENGKGNPSLNLLHRLAQALDISIGHLFSHDQDDEDFVMRNGMRPILATIAPSQGVALEALMSNQGEHLLQAHIHIVAPGGRDSSITHEGEEVGYVLEGELDLEVDGVEVHLEAGDSFFFNSQRPHRYANNGTSLTRVLWVNTPPTF